MKILALADISGLHWRHGSGQADLLVSCGDVTDQVILEAAEAHSCKAIFAVKGNHDPNTPFFGPIVDLHLQVRNKDGLRFGGLNGSWRYKARGNFLYKQWEVELFLASFPTVDIFVSHNSPPGIHDRQDEVHQGFDGLRSYILRTAPKVVIHGHQHLDRESQIESSNVVSVHGCKLIEI
jgi:Icc-related predicted phosphoesterase